jgi:alkylation response protein AidB-like acyl-CoA dehydrogenase
VSEFAGFHDELRAVAREVLGTTAATAVTADPVAVDWSVLVDAGWPGLEVAEALDGAGASFAEVAVVLDELGRAGAPTPFLGTAVLGVGLLSTLEPSHARDDVLRAIATGEQLVAAAVADGARGDAVVDVVDAPFRVDASDGALRVHGTATFVPDATDADHLLLLAVEPRGATVVVALPRRHPGVHVQPEPLLDASHDVATVTVDGVAVDDTTLLAFGGDPDAAVRGVLDRGALAMACDGLGLSAAMLDATVAYAGVREQFGRPIGAFQAVKHQCADLLVELSVARELVAAAVEAIVADPSGASIPVSMAASYVGDAAVTAAGTAMQLHGGIGYTWESGIHRYLKRAALERSLFGSPAAHRRRIARAYEGRLSAPEPV